MKQTYQHYEGKSMESGSSVKILVIY